MSVRKLFSVSVMILPAALALLVVSVGMKRGDDAESAIDENPFFERSVLPYEAPPFDKIKDTDFIPAFEKSFQEHLEEINKITDNTEAPTFENTFIPLEKSGQMFTRVNNAFKILSTTNTNPALLKVAAAMAPRIAEEADAVFLNVKLYNRAEEVYRKRADLNLDDESLFLVEYYHEQFELSGVKLPEADRLALIKLDEEEATFVAAFQRQMLNATKEGKLLFNTEAELSGLSAADLASAATLAKTNSFIGKWMVGLQNTTQQPSLQYLVNRGTRKRIFASSVNRAEKNDGNDTRGSIIRIAEIRAAKAALLGYKNYADWKLRDQMARTPEAVSAFLEKLIPGSTARAKTEAADMQALIDKQKGGFKLAPEDWNFYAEQIRKERFNLDASEVAPYFELNRVLNDGVFYAANQLYGLTFKERRGLPKYHPDVMVFEVFDQDRTGLGVIYLDYFKRSNKQGGASNSVLVPQSHLLDTKPVVINVANFTRPGDGLPALITFENVTSMFHEFGHALHVLLSNQQFASLSGVRVSADFGEFPSQFNEHWAMDPKVFARYAVHYQTGEKIPKELEEKIRKVGTFNQGYLLTESLAAMWLDYKWNTLASGKIAEDVGTFEKKALASGRLDLPEVPPRYHSSYFQHIWVSGFGGKYYAYEWSKMLSEDAYSWFVENGGMNRANGLRFRELILAKGHTQHYEALFKEFRGRDADIQALIDAHGLTDVK